MTTYLARHSRACPGYPRLAFSIEAKTWMPGTGPGMTKAAPILINEFTLSAPNKIASSMIAIPQ
jgi:hypothetical protein